MLYSLFFLTIAMFVHKLNELNFFKIWEVNQKACLLTHIHTAVTVHVEQKY